MYLQKFEITNFRSIKKADFSFEKGLNVLIGENNVGKTAVVDALRLCLGWGNYNRDITFRGDRDFFVDNTDPSSTTTSTGFHLTFAIENEEEKGVFLDLLNITEDGSENLQLHLQFNENQDGKIKYQIWGGANIGQQVSYEVLQLIQYVYLGALRDAEQLLRPNKDNKLSLLYSNISSHTQAEKDALVQEVESVLRNDSWEAFIKTGKEKIKEHLTETTFAKNTQEIEVGFSGFKFQQILNQLQLQIPIFKKETIEKHKTHQKYFHLWQNGLGYNNLIYIATVLGDIKHKKEKDADTYYALLIEEPEAHLHPQLQNLLFEYLSTLTATQDFQIFLSSHSPTISAKSSLDSLLVMKRGADVLHNFKLTNSALEPEDKTYLHKFLDVTKSQLFFSNGVILVEGISESLLLPIFGKKISVDTVRQGIEIVNINGVAFAPFAKLFNPTEAEKRINNRCAIITDDDRQTTNGDASSRADKALGLEGDLVKVFLARKNFEYELFIASKENREILLKVYKTLHPKTAIETDENEEQYAMNFANKVDAQKSKSELAHSLAIYLEDEENGSDYEKFTVPEYIQKALRYVVPNT